jgi:hypothetical protein
MRHESVSGFYWLHALDSYCIALCRCIIPSSLEAAERLPKSMGGVMFVVPRSLRREGAYAIVDLMLDESGQWLPIVEYCQL